MLSILNKKILLNLINNKNININEFIKDNNMTRRTLEYNMNNVNYLLKKVNVKVLSDEEIYYLENEDQKIKIKSVIEFTNTIDRAERFLIMKFILHFRKGLNLQKLTEELEISLTTAKKDLNIIKQEEQEIKYQKNIGFSVKTSESVKLILLKKIVSNKNVYEYLVIEYRDFFSYDKKIKDFIEFIKIEFNYKITTENYNLLYSYILLQINTLKSEKYDNNFIKDTEEFKEISEYWKNEKIITKQKLIKITDLILGLLIQPDKLENWLNEEILVKKLIKIFSDYIELNIKKDEVLYECLMYHLKPAIYRLKKGIRIDNTIFKDSFQEDDSTFEIIEKVLKELEEDLKIEFNEDEKYLLAYHFKASIDRNMYIDRKKVLIVCGLGYGTSKLLEKQLKENFNIDVVDIIPYHDLEEAVKIYKNLDLIISTLEIETELKISHIEIVTFLREKDNEKIIKHGIQRKKNKFKLSDFLETIELVKNKERKEIIEIIKEKYEDLLIDDLISENKNIKKLISKEKIKILDKVDNWEEAIKISGELLEKGKCVNKKYIDDMIRTVKNFGAYIVIDNEVAIPHGTQENTFKNGISILILKEFIYFNKEKKANMLIGFSINDKKNHKEILDTVFKISEKRDQLLKLKNKNEIYNYLLEEE